MANHISASAAQSALSIQELVTTMKTAGMTDTAIRQTLLNDLNAGGPLFGSFRNKLKNTVKNGVEASSNGSANGKFTKAGVSQFQWVSVGDGKVCPDCEERHGETGTMEYFETIGLPASGFSVCTTNCRCQLLPENYKGENLDKPLVRGEKISPIKNKLNNIGIKSTPNFEKFKNDKSLNVVYSQLSKLKKEGYEYHLTGLNTIPSRQSEWGEAWTNGIGLNPKYFNMPMDKIKKVLQREFDTGFSASPILESIITHEFAHTMTRTLNAGFKAHLRKGEYLPGNKIRNEFMAVRREYRAAIRKANKNISKHYDDYGNLLDSSEMGKKLAETAIAEKNKIFISRYAEKDLDEFIAESFAMYKHDPTASKFAIQVGKIIDKYYKD
jgi:hypothetical protein|tara:strand:+ start:239 stop:1387 length:1149 start_codon:yes stop_codon:yes gene_type:complete